MQINTFILGRILKHYNRWYKFNRKITSKGNLGSSSWFHKWKPTDRKELLVFFGLTINMGLINKSDINA